MKSPLRRNDLVYPELSYKLVGYAYEVFDELGPGHSEKTYQNAFALMLSTTIINMKSRFIIPLALKMKLLVKDFWILK